MARARAKIKQETPSEPSQYFYTWSDKEEDKSATAALNASMSGLKNAELAVQRTEGYLQSYRGIVPSGSAKQPFGRRDYQFFRPNERIPETPIEIMSACMQMYRRVGIIRNVIDLMADFASRGVDIVCKNKKEEKLYRHWFHKKVRGAKTSERFMNLFYRCGVAYVKRVTARLKGMQAREMQKAEGALADIDFMNVPDPSEPHIREIPWRYDFLNPLMVKPIGDELAMFAGSQHYALSIPPALKKAAENKMNAPVLASLSKDIREAILSGSKILLLNPEKFKAFFYKKDDWDMYGEPMTYSIISDVILLEKMKLADLAALDGAISKIRIWKVGNLEYKIMPGVDVMSKLQDIFLNNVGGGAVDIVWNPAIELQETSTDVYNFLGEKKYGPVLQFIYQGLGIPPALAAGSGHAGMTNSSLSLKTLIERLNYGRDALSEFWNEEIRLFQEAMGLKNTAKIQYEYLSVNDENMERKLWMDLADRGIISDEAVRERFSQHPDIEEARVVRETELRKKGQLPHRTGPFDNGHVEDDLLKIFAQTGQITPSEAGLELEEKAPDETSMLDHQAKTQEKLAKISKVNKPAGGPAGTKPAGQPGQGRPQQAKDQQARKRRSEKPRVSAREFSKKLVERALWATKAQETISEIINPIFMEMKGKKSLRAFNHTDFEELESFKFAILSTCKPYEQLDKDIVLAKAKTSDFKLPADLDTTFRAMQSDFTIKFGHVPSMDENRRIQSLVYAVLAKDTETP